MEDKKFVSLLADTTIKYLWKNNNTRKWLNEIILDKTGVDLSNYILVDNELNSGSKVKDYRLDLVFNNDKDTVILEINREYSLSGEIKGRRYLFRRAGNSFNSGDKYKNDIKTTLIMFNNYYKKNFEECKIATYTLNSKELNHTLNDIKIIEMFLPNYKKMCYYESNIDKRLFLFNATSYDEMRSIDLDKSSLYIIEELERLGMNDKFIDEYDTELVNRTMMESLKDEGYNEGRLSGLEEGRLSGIIETAKNMLKKNTDINFISECTGLSIDEINNLKKYI